MRTQFTPAETRILNGPVTIERTLLLLGPLHEKCGHVCYNDQADPGDEESAVSDLSLASVGKDLVWLHGEECAQLAQLFAVSPTVLTALEDLLRQYEASMNLTWKTDTELLAAGAAAVATDRVRAMVPVLVAAREAIRLARGRR